MNIEAMIGQITEISCHGFICICLLSSNISNDELDFYLPWCMFNTMNYILNALSYFSSLDDILARSNYTHFENTFS